MFIAQGYRGFKVNYLQILNGKNVCQIPPIDQVISFLMRFVKYGQINKDNTSEKLKPTAQEPFRDFNSRSG